MRVNPQTIRDLGEAVGAEALRDIAQALADTMDELARVHASLDDLAVTARSHSLKGSTSYLGTEDLFAQAVAADRACKEQRLGDARAILARMAEEWPGTWRELQSVLAS